MTDPTQVCEHILCETKASNIEKEIWPSQTEIIDHLLGRRLELLDAYAEIHKKLHAQPHGIRTMLDIVITVAAHWSPEQIAHARDARNRLEEINREIAELAWELAGLIEERSDISNTSGFSSDTHYHIVDVIDAASRDNYTYRWHLKEKLEALCGRYDLKYWPSLAEIVQAIGEDADFPGIAATNPLTRVATTKSRGSRADFFRALFEHIRENEVSSYGHIPLGFKLSDGTLASLANCALNLGPDDVVDAAYVKRLRQRVRNECVS